MTDSSWAANNLSYNKTDSLIPYERNPKTHPDSQIQQLANSIVEWGWTQPIVIDENKNVIAGHGRLYAAKSLGIDQVPCVTATGWSDAKKKAYIIADNKLSEKGHWDNALLYAELKSIVQDDFDLSIVSMDEDFALMDFTPNLEPSFANHNVGASDFATAQDNIQKQIDGATNLKNEQGIEVICPHCAEQFTISGY